jgi:hypothetical protein
MDYSKLNLTKLREQLKLRNIDGRSKLKTRDMIVTVLQYNDQNPVDKEGMRQLILSILNSNKSMDTSIAQISVPNTPQIKPRIAFTFEEIASPARAPAPVSAPSPAPAIADKLEVIDLTFEDMLKKADEIMTRTRKNLDEYRKVKAEIVERRSELEQAQPLKGRVDGTHPQTVKLEIPKSDYERLCKIVANYERSRIKSRENAQKKIEKEREEKKARFLQVGLDEFIKPQSKIREHHIKEMNLDEYIVKSFIH